MRLRRPTVTHIWEEKILTTDLWSIVHQNLKRNPLLTSQTTRVPSVASVPNAKKLRGYCRVHIRHQSSVRRSLKDSISILVSQGQNLRSSAWTCSRSVCLQWKMCLRILGCPRARFMRWSWLVVRPEFPRFNRCFQTSSMASSLIAQLTQMKPWLTVRQCRLQYFPGREAKMSRIYYF